MDEPMTEEEFTDLTLLIRREYEDGLMTDTAFLAVRKILAATLEVAKERDRFRETGLRLVDALEEIEDLHEVGVWQDIAEKALYPEGKE